MSSKYLPVGKKDLLVGQRLFYRDPKYNLLALIEVQEVTAKEKDLILIQVARIDSDPQNFLQGLIKTPFTIHRKWLFEDYSGL